MNIFLSVILIIISILLILIILAQPANNSGLQGDAMNANENNFFSKNKIIETLFKKITVILGILFFAIILFLSYKI